MCRVWLSALVLVLAACEDERIDQGRQDSGVARRDAGEDGVLGLEPGMMFTYDGTLTFRDENGDERAAKYALQLTIDAVDDALPGSTVTISATGERTFEQEWDAAAGAAGADSWVARAGPADLDDQVSTSPLTVQIGDAPVAPARRSIPSDSIFFLDLRQSETIRAAWSAAHETMSPMAIDPDQHPTGKWSLGLAGRDESIQFYPDEAKTRALTLEYDPRGFLTRADERLGDSSRRPNGSFTLNLVAGP